MGRVLVVGLLVGVLLAGCAAKPVASDPDEALFGDDVSVSVSSTTGAIRGVVVDEAIRPIPGVLVVLGVEAGAKNFTTTDAGNFAFSSLEPGTYFLTATRFGYTSAQANVEVVAGVAEPPIVKMQLVTDPEQVAYYSVQSFSGYIMCTSSVVAMCGAPNVVSNVLICPVFGVCLGNVTDDRFGFDLFYEPNATYIQSELVWQSTQPLSTALSMQMETIQGCDDEYYENTVDGNSPIINFATQEEIDEAQIGGACSIFHSIFSGDTAGTPLGFTVQQRYEVFSHSFYGFLPLAGWTFGGNGNPEPPQ